MDSATNDILLPHPMPVFGCPIDLCAFQCPRDVRRVGPRGAFPAGLVFARPRAQPAFGHGVGPRAVANAVERGGMVGFGLVVQTPSTRQVPAAEPVRG